MKKKVIFHCGTLKTGTSSIQNYLYRHRLEMLKLGVNYAESGLYHNEKGLGIRHNLLIFPYGSSGKDIEDQHDLLLTEITTNPYPTTIISTEAWSRPKEHKTLNLLLDKLRESSIEVEAVLYIRNYFDYARAFYREFCINRANKLHFSAFYSAWKGGALNYTKLFSELNGIFDGKVAFRPYDEIADVVADFLSLTNINSPPPYLQHSKFNMGQDSIDAEIFRWCNEKNLTPNPEFIQSLKGFLESLPGISSVGTRYIENPDFHLQKFNDHKTLSLLALSKLRAIIKIKKITGWPYSSVKNLFSSSTTGYRDISELRPHIQYFYRKKFT